LASLIAAIKSLDSLRKLSAVPLHECGAKAKLLETVRWECSFRRRNLLESINILRREFVRVVGQAGLLATLKRATQKLIQKVRNFSLSSAEPADSFDAKYGTETARIVPVGALDIPDEKLGQTVRYEAIGDEVFLGLMQELPIASEQYIFIDLGSGKGRALLLASLFPFKEIIGVEFSAALTAVALNNTRIFKDPRQKCTKIRPLCQDAATYELPLEAAIFFLYNPFGEKVMRSAVSNIEHSLQNCPRKVYAVYHQPLHRNIWDQSKVFQVVRTTDRYVIYESKCS
jgi:predicted RNA methylase